MTPIRDLEPDDVLDHRWLNALVAAIRRGALKAVPPLYVAETPEGTTIRFGGPQEAVFGITANGGGGAYTGIEQRATATGLWTPLEGGRTDTLYERNANSSVAPGTYVLARRETTSSLWLFDRGVCVPADGSPPPDDPDSGPSSPGGPTGGGGGSTGPAPAGGGNRFADEDPPDDFAPSFGLRENPQSIAGIAGWPLGNTMSGGGPTTATGGGGDGGPG